jgi:hypothetical protein
LYTVRGLGKEAGLLVRQWYLPRVELLVVTFTPPNITLPPSIFANPSLALIHTLIRSFIIYCVLLTRESQTTAIWRLAAAKLRVGRIILSPNLNFIVPPHDILQPHGHYTCSFTSIVMSDNGDYFDWDKWVNDLGGVDFGEAEQERSTAAFDYSTVIRSSNTTRTALAQQQQFNYELYDTGEDVRTADTYQPVPCRGTQPMVTSPNHTDMPMADAGSFQEWADLERSQRFYRSGRGQGGDSASTQETFPWQPSAPLHDWDNPVVSGLLEGHPVVNMQQVSNFMTDPHLNTISRASDTNPGVSVLGHSMPVQPVDQPYSSTRGSAVNYVGSSSFPLASRMAPLPSFIPPTGQERDPIADDWTAADTSSVLTGPEDPLPDPAMHHGVQERLGVGAQHVGANVNQTDPFRCRQCGKNLCNRVGLKYELHAMLLLIPG